MKSISVIIPCFNASRWIADAVNSVLRQDISDVEIIVIDDGSTDNSAGIIEKEFPHLRLIRTENQGPSRARNLGTKLSSGRFLQYLDADDIIAPGKIKIQLEALKNSDADVAYGDSQKLIEMDDGTFRKSEKIRRMIDNPEIGLLTADTWCPIHSYLFRRRIVEKIGGWNERLPFIQDARFALDCALHGAKFVHCPGSMVYYRIRKTDSVSTRNPIEHTKDCFRNALEIEEWWKVHGGISPDRARALLKVYGYVARAAFRKDRDTFNSVYRHIKELDPYYIPDGPIYFKLASRIFGYVGAENFLSWCSRVKRHEK